MKTLIILSILFAASLSYGKQNQDGRFQLVTLGDSVFSRYLLDTKTGNIWHQQCVKNKKGECIIRGWFKENVIGINISEKNFNNKYQDYLAIEKVEEISKSVFKTPEELEDELDD